MTALKTILFIFIIVLWGCVQTAPDASLKSSLSLQKDSISEQEIYDFMQIAITEQKLEKNNGLTPDYQPTCDLSISDEEFLQTLLIETRKQIDTSEQDFIYDSSGMIIGGSSTLTGFASLDKCLTNSDIEFMLQQKKDRPAFRWNNSKLGFNLHNQESWYVFSTPLFSKDRTKAILMIRDLCQGLCGTGRTVLFKKENNKWISQTGSSWFH